jgi:hypothetical protein
MSVVTWGSGREGFSVPGLVADVAWGSDGEVSSSELVQWASDDVSWLVGPDIEIRSLSLGDRFPGR